MADEQHEQQILHERMESLGVTDYELKGSVVFWKDEDFGSLAYLNSRRMDQLQDILDRVRKQKR